MEKNVLGTPLISCCTDPMTGFYRDGVCNTGPTDTGRHMVCAIVTAEFLTFSLCPPHARNISSPACARETAGASAPCAGRKLGTLASWCP
jgi:uncharacterized protein (DUF2237 family)